MKLDRIGELQLKVRAGLLLIRTSSSCSVYSMCVISLFILSLDGVCEMRSTDTTASVAVVVPVYNAGKENGFLIRQCLDSLLGQTMESWVGYLFDDGSTDNSALILQEYSEKWPGRFLVMSRPNKGVAATRNESIDLVEEEYIAFVDQDDFLDQDYLETLYREAETASADIVVSGYRRCKKDGVVYKRQRLKPSSGWAKYQVVAPWAHLYRSDFLKRKALYFFDSKIGEDVLFTLRAYGCAERISTLSYMGYTWYHNDHSVSNTSQKGFDPSVDPYPLMEGIKGIPSVEQREYLNYYLLRYSVWYLLWNGRSVSRTRFLDEERKMRAWMGGRVCGPNRIKWIKMAKEDGCFDFMIIVAYMALRAFGLLPLFAFLYCRKGD